MNGTRTGIRWRWSALVLSCLAAGGPLGLPPTLAECATPILARADARVWQTVFKPSEPLAWRWAPEAVSARLTVTNALNRREAASQTVARVGDGLYGTYRLPDVARSTETGEGLVDVVLEQLDDLDAVVDRSVARLALLPGSDGGAFRVEKRKPSGWRMRDARVAAYDAMWSDATKGATSAVAVLAAPGEAPVERALDGTGGYFDVQPAQGVLSLSFDGVCADEGVLRLGGLLLSYR